MTAAAPWRAGCHRIEQLDSTVLEAWQQLHAAHHGVGGAFFSPGYAQAAHEALQREVRVVTLWHHSALVGVLPLQRQAGWWGRAGLFVPVGGEMTDYAGLLAEPGVKIDWPALLQAARVPCLYFTHLDESQQTHGLGGEQPRIGLRTAMHSEGGAAHWEQLRMLDKKLVSDTERRERKLAQDHGELMFELRSSQPEADLATLIGLKNAQYLRTGKSAGPLLQPGNVRLLEILLRQDGPGCKVWLSTLKVNGRMVAAHLGLVAGSTLHFWFPVYDEGFARYSPGRVLMRHILCAAGPEGVNLIDRGEGDTPAKRDFATGSHLYLRGLVWRGWHGWLVAASLRLAWRHGAAWRRLMGKKESIT